MLTIERDDDDDDKDATEELNLEDDGFEDLKHTDWDSEALMTLESIVEKIDSIDTLNDPQITTNVDEDIVIQLPVECEHPAEETAKIFGVEITAPAASVSGTEKTTSVSDIPSAQMKTEPKKKTRVRPWRTKRQAAGSVGPEPAAAAAKPKQSKPQEARRERAKEFFCSKCNQGFTMKSNCIRHEKYECGQKPRFMCPHCGLRCKQTSQIYVHIRRKHPNEEIYVISVENSRDKKKARTAASKRIFLRSVPRILRHRASREYQSQSQQQQREMISVLKTRSDRNSDSHPGTSLAGPDCGKVYTAITSRWWHRRYESHAALLRHAVDRGLAQLQEAPVLPEVRQALQRLALLAQAHELLLPDRSPVSVPVLHLQGAHEHTVEVSHCQISPGKMNETIKCEMKPDIVHLELAASLSHKFLLDRENLNLLTKVCLVSISHNHLPAPRVLRVSRMTDINRHGFSVLADLFLISSSKLLNTSASSSTPGTPASQSPASASGAAEPQQHHKCKHCGATYQVRSMLERHLARTCKRVPRSEIYQCNFCAYQSTYKANIERHVRNLHDAMQADYKCELCDFKSKYLYCVRRHMKTFHPQ
ncbi:unnamed protein product [Trichogramma brassicae]|uniref:C2H2-type domain-containing protein n=1 Tax=Trichogramma brassicae TaxID=86971 RepID=A0A6H5HWQ6_9HYME|nr:unnamed protein product [Trichogramma brassicae]